MLLTNQTLIKQLNIYDFIFQSNNSFINKMLIFFYNYYLNRSKTNGKIYFCSILFSFYDLNMSFCHNKDNISTFLMTK